MISSSIGYILLNFFSFLVLLIINNWKTSKEGVSFEQKLFDGMLFITLLLLLTDSSIWILSGKNTDILHILNIISTVAYFICHPLLLSLWVMYSDYSLFRERKKTIKLAFILAAVNLVFDCFIIASIWYGYIFIIDESNTYSRGSGFMIFFAACYALILYVFFVVLFNRKKADRGIIKILLLFALPPTAAGVLQAYIYGISVIWPAMSLSVLMIYINIQNSLLTTDYLTGIFNRRQFESILNRKIISGRREFSLIMLDLDNFKSINDNYGHTEGDHALETAVQIIQSSLRTGDITARYAGDEFLVLLDSGDANGLAAAVARIRKKSAEWNEGNSKPYRISFSMGYEVFKVNRKLTLEEIVKRVDALMYDDKKNKTIHPR